MFLLSLENLRRQIRQTSNQSPKKNQKLIEAWINQWLVRRAARDQGKLQECQHLVLLFQSYLTSHPQERMTKAESRTTPSHPAGSLFLPQDLQGEIAMSPLQRLAE